MGKIPFAGTPSDSGPNAGCSAPPRAFQPNDGLIPLYWPHGVRPAYSGVLSDQMWRYVPFLGVLSRNLNWRRFIRPIAGQLNAQIMLRPSVWDLWRSTGTPVEFVQLLSKEVADEMEWPNNHFIPDDPLEIVMFQHSGGDGGELVQILFSLERRAGVRLNDIPNPELFQRETYGEFVGRCWAKVGLSAWARALVAPAPAVPTTVIGER